MSEVTTVSCWVYPTLALKWLNGDLNFTVMIMYGMLLCFGRQNPASINEIPEDAALCLGSLCYSFTYQRNNTSRDSRLLKNKKW